jgi:hypothetical protein
MNTPTPTPRTDAATYPADCLGKTLVTNRDCARALETELGDITAERDQLRAENATLRAAQKACEACDEPTAFEVRQLRAELATEREKGERYRLASLKLEADLTTERARLDWVFRNCKVTADDFTTGNRDVYAIRDREDLGAAMKEDAK